MLTLLVSALCTADCADTWITFHILIFCWNENLQGPLKWMGRVVMSIKWCAGTDSENLPLSSCMSLMGASWKETSSPGRLGVHGTGGFYEHPGQQLLLPWVFLKWDNTTQGLCTCHQCDCSDDLDAESGPFIIQHNHQVTTKARRDVLLISKIKPRTSWVKLWKRISKGA